MAEQQRYQVRFDWATDGAHAIGSDADVIVWVDAMETSGAGLVIEEMPVGAALVEVSMMTAAAAAKWVSALQHDLGQRVVVAVVAAGEPRHSGRVRFAVEDLLAAGAFINHLAMLGLDATSPEAAAPEAAYRALERGIAHLLTASVTSMGSPLPEQLRRVDTTLGPDDVRVRRPHPRR